jgi:hypothetical protein
MMCSRLTYLALFVILLSGLPVLAFAAGEAAALKAGNAQLAQEAASTAINMGELHVSNVYSRS